MTFIIVKYFIDLLNLSVTHLLSTNHIKIPTIVAKVCALEVPSSYRVVTIFNVFCLNVSAFLEVLCSIYSR